MDLRTDPPPAAQPEARTDPRIARTRRLLHDALLSLARERDLDTIAVADIADRATINRSTFYQHYPDKETLLADALDEQARLAGADLSALLPLDESDQPPALLVRYLEHLDENAALYRRALGETGSPLTTARLRRRMTTIVTTGLEGHGFSPGEEDLPVAIAAASITGSLIGVLTAWLEMTPRPSTERAASWVWQMLVPARQHDPFSAERTGTARCGSPCGT
ncbi:TetR/AcrR family transcriptional regulator [Sanguibacter antarcticus]|uniref:TetR family transcriptional regulator n=1 Tax=Sanguibacter antarcticus TaxID=372484 RepID=A0A2A9E7J0_9MICO|nr:TetR/AcrR family transcriptional regulator [Sanguibacter antarcticus]PFG34189.1 TetR family transcriptional regulator [Sanguibacter antarcticus]